MLTTTTKKWTDGRNIKLFFNKTSADWKKFPGWERDPKRKSIALYICQGKSPQTLKEKRKSRRAFLKIHKRKLSVSWARGLTLEWKEFRRGAAPPALLMGAARLSSVSQQWWETHVSSAHGRKQDKRKKLLSHSKYKPVFCQRYT